MDAASSSMFAFPFMVLVPVAFEAADSGLIDSLSAPSTADLKAKLAKEFGVGTALSLGFLWDRAEGGAGGGDGDRPILD